MNLIFAVQHRTAVTEEKGRGGVETDRNICYNDFEMLLEFLDLRRTTNKPY